MERLKKNWEKLNEFLEEAKPRKGVSVEVIGSGPESGSFPKMLESLEENMKMITGKEEPLKKSLLVGDTGYFSVVDKKYKDNLSEKMRKKIDNPAYRELYSRRMQIVESVYSNITYNK